VHSLCSAWQLTEIAFENLGEGIEETPCRPAFPELWIPWLSPFLEHVGYPRIHSPDDQVMRPGLNDPAAFGFANVTDQAKSGSIGVGGTVVA
jgi:hypothetical protein